MKKSIRDFCIFNTIIVLGSLFVWLVLVPLTGQFSTVDLWAGFILSCLISNLFSWITQRFRKENKKPVMAQVLIDGIPSGFVEILPDGSVKLPPNVFPGSILTLVYSIPVDETQATSRKPGSISVYKIPVEETE